MNDEVYINRRTDEDVIEESSIDGKDYVKKIVFNLVLMSFLKKKTRLEPSIVIKKAKLTPIIVRKII